MKALTIRQPWANLVISGQKPVENRSRVTQFRGLVAIHSSKDLYPAETVDAWKLARERGLGDVPPTQAEEYGAVLGVATLVGTCEQSDSPWFTGPIGWVFTRPLRFERPVVMKGALGLWAISATFLPAIEEQLRLAVFEAGRQAEISAGFETACRGCGCSESRCCEGGCYWVADAWCSACQDKSELAEMRTVMPGHGGTA